MFVNLDSSISIIIMTKHSKTKVQKGSGRKGQRLVHRLPGSTSVQVFKLCVDLGRRAARKLRNQLDQACPTWEDVQAWGLPRELTEEPEIEIFRVLAGTTTVYMDQELAED